MQFFVNDEPVLAGNFVRANLRSSRFTEDLGRTAVDVVQAGGFECADDFGETHAMALGHVLDFRRRKERELHVRQRFLEAAHQRQPIIE